MNQQNVLSSVMGIFYILSIFTFSCNIDNAFELPEDGQDTADCYFPPPNDGNFGYGYDYIFDSIQYERPYFNPNNPDEFIYLENGDLYKYKISTYEKTLLFTPESYIFFQPKWSRKGKIAFNTSDFNIWIMNDNGDSVKKITNVDGDISINYYGEFNYAGDSLMFETEGDYIDSDSRKIRIAYNNFSEFDTIFSNNLSANGNWQKPGHLIFISYDCINLAKINGFELPVFICNEDTLFSSGGSTIWLENKEDFYCYGNGIYSGNFNTNYITKIQELCSHIYYLFVSYSEITKKVIASKVTKEYLGNNKVYVKNEIIIMNPDGSDEQIILPKPE